MSSPEQSQEEQTSPITWIPQDTSRTPLPNTASESTTFQEPNVLKAFKAVKEAVTIIFQLKPDSVTLCINVVSDQKAVCKEFPSKERAESAYDIGLVLFKMLGFTVKEVKPD